MINKLLTLIAVLASGSTFAQDTAKVPNDEIIGQIIANENLCVVEHSKDRIYLNPDRIHPTLEGVYLNLNDVDYILLPALGSDINGCYVRSVNVQTSCPGCGQPYGAVCNNTNCGLRIQNQDLAKASEPKQAKTSEKKEIKEKKKKKKK